MPPELIQAIMASLAQRLNQPQDATANPAAGAGTAPAIPFSLDAVRGSPFGILADVLAGMSPAGPAIDAADFAKASAEGDNLGMGLAGIGFIPFLGDFVKGAGKALQKGAKGPFNLIRKNIDSEGAIMLEHDALKKAIEEYKSLTKSVPAGSDPFTGTTLKISENATQVAREITHPSFDSGVKGHVMNSDGAEIASIEINQRPLAGSSIPNNKVKARGGGEVNVHLYGDIDAAVPHLEQMMQKGGVLSEDVAPHVKIFDMSGKTEAPFGLMSKSANPPTHGTTRNPYNPDELVDLNKAAPMPWGLEQVDVSRMARIIRKEAAAGNDQSAMQLLLSLIARRNTPIGR